MLQVDATVQNLAQGKVALFGRQVWGSGMAPISFSSTVRAPAKVALSGRQVGSADIKHISHSALRSNHIEATRYVDARKPSQDW